MAGWWGARSAVNMGAREKAGGMTTARARQRMLGRCKRKWQSWGQTKNKHGKRKQAAMAQCELTAARLAPQH